MSTMINELKKMNEEKRFRVLMYVSKQANEAKEVNGAITIYDLLNEETDEKYFLLFKDGKNKYDFGPTYDLDISCDSCFIDGNWGYWNEDQTTFWPFSDYGKTWAAVPYREYVAEEGWPLCEKVVDQLTMCEKNK